jgi:transcriptional regulator
MYLPTQFHESRPEVLAAFVRAHPLAAVIANTANGLTANHIPILLDPKDDGINLLMGHIARANTLWNEVSDGAEILVIFQGSEHYISPQWYPSKQEHGKVVPTWNYGVVHVSGTINWVHDPAWLRAHVAMLTDAHESAFPTPWRVADAPPDYIANMLKGIVGLQIQVRSVTCKLKASQNRSVTDRTGVVSGLEAQGGDSALEMARLVQRGNS